MYYTHAQKQTNKQTHKHNSLSLSWARSSLDTPVLQHLSGEDNCYNHFFSCRSSHVRQHNSFNTAPSLRITTLPRPTACPSWDGQTLWPPHRWSFERVSSWWSGRFHPWRCSSLRGSSQNSCHCPPALGAGSPSCQWRGPRGRSSSPSLRRAARRPPDHVRYLEHWGKMKQRAEKKERVKIAEADHPPSSQTRNRVCSNQFSIIQNLTPAHLYHQRHLFSSLFLDIIRAELFPRQIKMIIDL